MEDKIGGKVKGTYLNEDSSTDVWEGRGSAIGHISSKMPKKKKWYRNADNVSNSDFHILEF
jgi:hypothetical protein